MCSWCYAFAPVLQQLRQQLPEQIDMFTVLGGLAADTDTPMPIEMQQQLQATWQHIEQKVPGIQFNYDFWKPSSSRSTPRRATYPACRAVITAQTFGTTSTDTHNYAKLMTEAIQKAYYQQARNPSDNQTLITLAQEIGLDKTLFQSRLQSHQTQLELERQIALSRQLKVSSYPSLVLQIDSSYWPVSVDYLSVDPILETIHLLLDFE